MRFVIYADASPEVGTGHVLRSCVIAEEAISRGFDCIFIGRIVELEWVEKHVDSIGFSQIINDLDSFVPVSDSDVLVLDSYDEVSLQKVLEKGGWKYKVLIADDSTPMIKVDLVIKPGIREINSLDEFGFTLGGLDYLLLRKSIKKLAPLREPNQNTSILVVGGGSDPFEFSESMAQILDQVDLDFEVHFFVNRKISSSSGKKFIIHDVGPELDYIAETVDLVFCPASTSSFEFLARGLPVGVASAVKNQEENYRNLGQAGLAVQIGFRNGNNEWKLDLNVVSKFIFDKTLQKQLSNKISTLIDLAGAKRIVSLITESTNRTGTLS